jgi:hypothetical protein
MAAAAFPLIHGKLTTCYLIVLYFPFPFYQFFSVRPLFNRERSLILGSFSRPAVTGEYGPPAGHTASVPPPGREGQSTRRIEQFTNEMNELLCKDLRGKSLP